MELLPRSLFKKSRNGEVSEVKKNRTSDLYQYNTGPSFQRAIKALGS